MRASEILRRARYETDRLRSLGPRERAREILQVNDVSWQTHGELRDRVAALESRPEPAPVQVPVAVPEPSLAREIVAMHAWLAALPEWNLKVSVILPTRDRPALLPRAIDSVLAQRHRNWELLVVDDGDGPGAEVPGDPRIRVLDGPRRGPCAARNAGLAAATGDVVAYLDDDNVLLDHWLGAVAWAFERHPGVDVLYGGAIRELPWTSFPDVHLMDWDRRAVEQNNIADMGQMAHRRDLPEARFDEDLRYAGDWDLLVRLTAERAPLVLPVVGMAYTQDASDRLTDEPGNREGTDRVRAKIRASRPLRLLACNWMFPLVSETYILEELHSLVPHGAELAFYREEVPPGPMPIAEKLYTDLDLAVAEFQPDLLFLHWAVYADRLIPTLERLGLPFAVRLHGFDVDREQITRLQAHPLCIGVWTYPSPHFRDFSHFQLSPILSSVDRLPEPAPKRDLVLSTSAGLAKKDFPLLVGALGRLGGVERRIVLGATKGFNHLPADVVSLCEELPDPPLVQTNLTYDQVRELMARTAVLVYTLRPDVRFGMPMSIIEGLCSGCAIIVPDRPECLDYAGPNARPYVTADDIVRQCRDVLAGGPQIERERRENVAYGRERFASPELGRRFYDELRGALDAHHRSRSPAPVLA